MFVANIMEKRLDGFSWNFQDMSGPTRLIIRLFYDWLDRSTVSKLGAAECLLE